MKQNPRYNVLSCRLCDEDARRVRTLLNGGRVSDYLLQLVKTDLESKTKSAG